jgi:hypothetical protein
MLRKERPSALQNQGNIWSTSVQADFAQMDLTLLAVLGKKQNIKAQRGSPKKS